MTEWIDQPEQLAAFCEEAGDLISVDTESDHFHAYQAKVCLIQVATPEAAALVDPLALDARALQPLFELIEDPGVVTLMHSGRNDIREMDRDWGVGVANLFDTQIAAKFLGYAKNGLSWMQEELIGKPPAPSFQRYDWTTRPIPADAREYAAADVVDLLTLYDRFLPELEEAGWLEAFRDQCAYVATAASFEPSPFDPEDWRRVTDAKKLDDASRAALRELYIARHDICTAENRAAFLLLPDDALARIARERPSSVEALAGIRRVKDAVVDGYAQLLLDAVERARDLEPPPARPRRKPRPPRPPQSQVDRFQALKEWRNRTADELDIPRAFVATNTTLSDIAADPPDSVAGLDAFVAVLPWHRRMLGDEIIALLAEHPDE